ncbi:hypothetical protein ABEK51_27350, partial [Klebsiella pneumoniae]
MAKIQARNVDDALFARIEQSAMKNERSLEGEIRLALARQYPAGTTSPEILSSRQQWQKECGGRLRALFGTVAKLAMRQPFVLFKGLTFQKLCLP